VILLAGPPGRADEVSEAREHYKKGTKAFELGAFQEAVAEYAAAYRLRDDPALLYNLAQSNRLANHPLEALRLYRMFLLKTPNASNREEVESKIAELRKLVEQQQTTPNPPLDARQAPPPSGPTVTQPPTPEQTVSGVLLGVGGAAVVTGTVLFLVGRHEQKAARTLSFVPGAGRGFAGAFVSGSF